MSLKIMETLVEKVSAWLPELEVHGPVYFFALGDRPDVHWWDLILSAAWSDGDNARHEAIQLLTDMMLARLEPDEFFMLAGTVIVPSSEPGIRYLPKSWSSVPKDEAQSVQLDLLTLEIRRAYIFKAQRPPRLEEAAPLAAAA